MTNIDILKDLAYIDEMIALRDKLRRDPLPKCQCMAKVLTGQIADVRQRITQLTRPLPPAMQERLHAQEVAAQ